MAETMFLTTSVLTWVHLIYTGSFSGQYFDKKV